MEKAQPVEAQKAWKLQATSNLQADRNREWWKDRVEPRGKQEAALEF